MVLILCLIFLLSGASALLFETLWFRLAGLMLGNSVWASSLVLSGFMAGLALGNALSGRYARRLTRPILCYALLEVAIGGGGLSLVLLFPALAPLLAPVFRACIEHPWALNAVRLALAFALMLIPSTAMGATLPVLVRALTPMEPRFGRLLGRLYGWNTLGAVVGAVAGEAVLIERLGLRGTGVFAALLNLVAAAGALLLASRSHAAGPPAATGRAPAYGPRARRLLAGALLSGGILLALEVIWFRFLSLFVYGTSLTFAVMLAVVLLGISAGGFGASWWLTRRGDATRFLPHVALVAGWLCTQAYVGFGSHVDGYSADPSDVWRLSVWLMFPVSLLSGILFSLLGAALEQELGEGTRAAGSLTLANTIGATLGAAIAGFVLLPGLGMEGSFFALALTYGAVAALCLQAGPQAEAGGGRKGVWLAVAAGAFALPLALFPFGLMKNSYVRVSARTFTLDGSKIVAVREGLTETSVYLTNELWGEPLYHRLVTNGFSMSGTQLFARRYMKLFVYLPMALRPEARRALLISYGVGSTAKALTDTKSLEAIDVVDISPDILDSSRIVFPSPRGNPLADPRVRVHVEDGRFFLLTTGARFDLITAEPPPPKGAGVVNLYTREYFQLIRDRLSEGGIVSYWLPVFLLEAHEAQAVARGFCSVFEDCSLWVGQGANWMLVGTRQARHGPDERGFRRQWEDPTVRREMQALGFEVPEQLGALFIADAPFLREWTRETPPLEDNRPLRLSLRRPAPPDPAYQALTDTEATKKRFEGSRWVQAMWPSALRQATMPYFDEQRILNKLEHKRLGDKVFWGAYGTPRVPRLTDLRRVLSGTALRSLPLFLMAAEEAELEIAERAEARGMVDPWFPYLKGVRAMAERRYRDAEQRFAEAQRSDSPVEDAVYCRILASSLAGDGDAARRLIHEAREAQAGADRETELWSWLESTTTGTPPR